MDGPRRPASAAFWLVLIGLLAWGCGGPETVDEPPRYVAPHEEESVSQVGQGGTARLALPASLRPACLNPYRPRCHGAGALTGVVFEAPLAVGPALDHKPVLAEAMPAYGAGTLKLEPFTVEVRLRRGVTFSDGEPLTSADLEWTYQRAARLAKEGGISPPYAGFERLQRVETPDERTARLVFREPYALWRDLLTAPILPKHAYAGEGLGGLSLNRAPTGSGPFLLESRTDETLSFVENPGYRMDESPLPNLEGLEMEFVAPREAAESLLTGRADFGFFATTNRLPASGDLLRARAARTRVEQLLFNSRTLDRERREVLAGALDRDLIAARVGAPVTQSFVSPKTMPGYAPAWRGRDEREAPGDAVRTEEPLRMVYPAGSPGREAVAEELVSEYSSVGLKIESLAVPPGDFFGEVLPEGDFDLALYGVSTPAEYETLAPVLPPDSAAELAEGLSAVDESGRALTEAQESMAKESALLPLFVWPDAYAWSSTLDGPRADTPYRGIVWNAREWGIYK